MVLPFIISAFNSNQLCFSFLLSIKPAQPDACQPPRYKAVDKISHEVKTFEPDVIGVRNIEENDEAYKQRRNKYSGKVQGIHAADECAKKANYKHINDQSPYHVRSHIHVL